MNKLPLDLQRYIFSFDPTYHEHYQYEIIPYLENLWTIKYLYKHNDERGIDLSHLFSGPFATHDWNNGYWIENGTNLDYSYKKAKKICDYLTKEHKEFIFKPEHRYYGDLTHHHHLWSNCSVILQPKEYEIFHINTNS